MLDSMLRRPVRHAHVIGEASADDPAGVGVDDDGEITPALGGRHVGDVTGPDLVDSGGDRTGGQKIERWAVGFSITGPGSEILGLKRAKLSFLHQPPHSRMAGGQTEIAEFVMNPAVAVAPPMFAEDVLDLVTKRAFAELGGGGLVRGVVGAAGQIEYLAGTPDAGSCFLTDGVNHRALLERGLVPRITAACAPPLPSHAR